MGGGPPGVGGGANPAPPPTGPRKPSARRVGVQTFLLAWIAATSFATMWLLMSPVSPPVERGREWAEPVAVSAASPGLPRAEPARHGAREHAAAAAPVPHAAETAEATAARAAALRRTTRGRHAAAAAGVTGAEVGLPDLLMTWTQDVAAAVLRGLAPSRGGGSGSVGQVCRDMGNSETGGPPNVTAWGGVDYGPWRLAWPRFTRNDHVAWWNEYQVATWRRGSGCAVQAHPWSGWDDAQLAAAIAERAAQGHPFPHVPPHAGYFTFCAPGEVRGEVRVLHDATVAATGSAAHECDSSGSVKSLELNAITQADPTVHFDTMFWGVIPASGFFQHWIQNNMPKIAQASLVVEGLLPRYVPPPSGGGGSRLGGGPSVSLLRLVEGGPTYRGMTAQVGGIVENQELMDDRFPIVRTMHDHLGWGVVDLRSRPVHVTNLVYACNTPALHPFLWQRAQDVVLRVVPKPVPERRKLVYCGRTRTGRMENEGRRVLNEEGLLDLLAAWGDQYQLVEFDHRKHDTVASLVEFWSDARALIGPHGGCLTNVVFMGCNSLVVELFPLVNGWKPNVLHAGMMMYMQSMFLDHEYWMVPTPTEELNGDFTAPLLEVCDILMMSLGSPDADVPATPAGCRQLLPTVMPRTVAAGNSYPTYHDRGPGGPPIVRVWEAPGLDPLPAGVAGVGRVGPVPDGVGGEAQHPAVPHARHDVMHVLPPQPLPGGGR